MRRKQELHRNLEGETVENSPELYIVTEGLHLIRRLVIVSYIELSLNVLAHLFYRVETDLTNCKVLLAKFFRTGTNVCF